MLFIILLPLILGIGALVIDVGLQVQNKIKLVNVTKIAIMEAIDHDSIYRVKDVLEKNEINVDNLEIKEIDNKINVKNEYEIDSIFGNILGIKKYQINVDIIGYSKDDKIVFE